LFPLLAAASFSAAQQPWHQPPAQEYIRILEDPHRIAHLKPQEIIKTLGLKQGDVAADVGSGSGLFTRLMAQTVKPGGKVYAVDIDKELLKHVAKTAAEQGITNITTILGEPDSPQLPRDSLDLALICDTLHHIEKRERYLENLKPAPKRSGRLAIIDFSDDWPAGHEPMRFSLENLNEWTSRAGYVLSAEYNSVPGNFFRIYRLR
jgi:ubiquinone/menaquinone biosynthesis C-methylase UbiE